MDRTLIWQLAIRYLRGKRTANAVPILSRISMIAIAVSSAAMIIIFSVMNGLTSTVKDMYKAFYPDLKVTAARGKFFTIEGAKTGAIKNMAGVQTVTSVIEDNVLVNNNKEQKVITLKGVDKNYAHVNDYRDYIVTGQDSVAIGNPSTAIAGIRILHELGLDVNNIFSTFDLYYLNTAVTNPEANPTSAYQSLTLHPTGGFQIQDDFDGKYVLAPLPLVQTLFKQEGRFSSIELSVEPGKADNVKAQLQQLLGNAYVVASRYEQNKTMYAVMGGEKWAIYAILVFVLCIAAFNMVGALSMLVLEKQKDIAILKVMGAQQSAIRKIFLAEGMLWSVLGGATGMLLGFALCLAQEKFGFVKLGSGMVMDAYPVELQFADFVLVAVTILIIGFLVSWYPAMRSTRAVDPSLKST